MDIFPSQRTTGRTRDTAVSWCSKQGRGIKVADAARFGEVARKNRIIYGELQETVEFMNAKQSELLAQVERKQTVDVWSLGGRIEESPPGRLGLGRQDLGGGK